MFRAVRKTAGILKRRWFPQRAAPADVGSYWTTYNVTGHQRFASAEASAAYVRWRNGLYVDHLRWMPIAGHDGKVVLDYGCGPGNDLVGIGLASKPARLIGVDVSSRSIEESRERLALHGIPAELAIIPEAGELPLPDVSVDYIHCNGVLHHTTDSRRVLRELRRVLRPGGALVAMVYNYQSVYLHLYVAHIKQIVDGYLPELDVRDALRPLTDGPGCPISRVARPDEFIAEAESTGFRCEFLGSSVAMLELEMLPRRFAAIQDRRLAEEHREFLLALSFDQRGVPFHLGAAAGLNAYFRLTPADRETPPS